MRDVPLKDAVIAMNRGNPPDVRVIKLCDAMRRRYDITLGAGEDRWDAYPDHRLGFLYETMWSLAHLYGVPTDIIHVALQAIPEYRDLEGNDLRPSR
jgi:hypothetical protein